MYDGALGEFLMKTIKQYLPPISSIRGVHQWLCREIDKGVGPFPVRQFASSVVHSTLSIRPKVNYFSGGLLPFDLIASDNEPNSSLYAFARRGDISRLSSGSLCDAITNGIISIGIFQNGVTSMESLAAFRNLGIRGLMNNHEDRVAVHSMKLYHLTDAGSLGENNCSAFSSLGDELKCRIFRLLSPLNVVPYPLIRNDKFGEWVEGFGGGEFGESAIGQQVFSGALAEVMKSHCAFDLIESWRDWARPAFTAEQSIDSFKNWSSRRLRISDRRRIRIPDDHHQDGASITDVTVTAAEARNLPEVEEFLVKENGQGRFHLYGFGVTIGGQNRELPFRFKVMDARGAIIAESPICTAKALGIAAARVGEYNNDRYRQSNFFERQPNGDVVPKSAIAKRIKWH